MTIDRKPTHKVGDPVKGEVIIPSETSIHHVDDTDTGKKFIMISFVDVARRFQFVFSTLDAENIIIALTGALNEIKYDEKPKTKRELN